MGVFFTVGMIADQESRDRGARPGRSFIVQAPAGSGKTDLLVKRYIKLLGVVRSPRRSSPSPSRSRPPLK